MQQFISILCRRYIRYVFLSSEPMITSWNWWKINAAKWKWKEKRARAHTWQNRCAHTLAVTLAVAQIAHRINMIIYKIVPPSTCTCAITITHSRPSSERWAMRALSHRILLFGLLFRVYNDKLNNVINWVCRRCACVRSSVCVCVRRLFNDDRRTTAALLFNSSALLHNERVLAICDDWQQVVIEIFCIAHTLAASGFVRRAFMCECALNAVHIPYALQHCVHIRR